MENFKGFDVKASEVTMVISDWDGIGQTEYSYYGPMKLDEAKRVYAQFGKAIERAEAQAVFIRQKQHEELLRERNTVQGRLDYINKQLEGYEDGKEAG